MPLAPRSPRGGLDGHEIRAIGLGLYVWALCAGVVLFVGGAAGLSFWQILLLIGFGGGLAGGGTATFALVGARKVGMAAQMVYAPSGASTPYERVFSYQEAMAMRGDVAGALASFEALIHESPGDAAVRLAAAELYATRGGLPARAAELYREVRRLPGATPGHDFVATNALIDLYRGPLADESRARAELRRLAARYPKSVPGEMARRALAAEMESPKLQPPS